MSENTESEANFEIIAGTYEEFTLGYKFQVVGKNYSLTQSFATHDHTGSVRTVAFEGKYVASGGSDDRVFVYDMAYRREQTVLTHHKGTVSCIAFTPDGTHLLTAAEDGVLAAVRTGNWQVEKLWTKAHGGTGVQMIAIHPSGKLALTLGNDITLRTWNLVKGRQAYVVRLQSHMRNAYSLAWSSDEKTFAIFSTRFLEIWSIESGGCIEKTEQQVLVSSCCWLKDMVVAGHEDGVIMLFDSKLNVLFEDKTAHKTRIKCVTSANMKYVISADSSGKIVVWKLKKKKLVECCSTSAGCRVTALAIMKPISMKKNKDDEEENQAVETEEIASGSDTEKQSKNNEGTKKRKSAFIIEEQELDYEDNSVKKVKKKNKKKLKTT